MRVLGNSNNNNTSQKAIIGTNNCGTVKLKKEANNTKSNSKQVQRGLSSDKNKENLTFEELKSGLVRNSKKIQKMSQKEVRSGKARKVSDNFTNTSKINSSNKNPRRKCQTEKNFKEDTIKYTSNYATLSYFNSHTEYNHQFYYFHDHDLGFPKDLETKTITNRCDNDGTTDDDQVTRAVKNVSKIIKDHILSLQKKNAL